MWASLFLFFFFFQAEDGIRDLIVTGVQTCALPIWYVPFGTRHVPPPASASDFKAARNASVSFVTLSPTAPNVLTFTTRPALSWIGLVVASVVEFWTACVFLSRVSCLFVSWA